MLALAAAAAAAAGRAATPAAAPPTSSSALRPPAPRRRSSPATKLLPAGEVLGAIEGALVVRAAPGERSLAEGLVLALGDRLVLGTIEELLSPAGAAVHAALRCAGRRCGCCCSGC